MLLRELLSEKWSEKYKRSIDCANPKGFSQKAHCQGRNKEEDYHPNETPPGPETKPTMPAGTVRVDVSDVYDWYKLGQHIANLKGLGKHDFGKGPPSTIFSFGSEEEEHDYIKNLAKSGLTTTDIDPLDPNQPKGMKRQKTDPTFNVGEAKKRKRKKVKSAAYGPGPYGWYGYYPGYSGEYGSGEGGGDGGGMEENFADGRNPQDKGDAKRHGVPTKASVSTLRKVAKQGGRKGQLAHWMANMKAGRKKANESIEEHEVLKAFRDFLPVAMKVLKISKLPKIKLTAQVDDTDQPTFGRFINDTMVIEIGMSNRHILDILRTLAHELTHYKQFITHRIGPHSGDTGSPEENEAHAVAGVIMRHFNKANPHYFKDQPLNLEEQASSGATSSASIASVVNPHHSPGPARGTKSYIGSPGKSGTKSPPQPKPKKQKPTDNALDLKGSSIFGGPAIKR